MAETQQKGPSGAEIRKLVERGLATDQGGTLMLDASDGRYTIMLGRVVYMKRYARESRVGFGI